MNYLRHGVKGTAWQRASGHNISLHHVARAYHLRAIAFFDEAPGRA
jgi:hypothetical protein